MAKKNKRIIIVFEWFKFRKVSDFIEKVRTIILDIGNAPLIFVTPKPALSGFTTDVNDLNDAQIVAKTRVTGSAAARDVKYNIVANDVYDVVAYVQDLVNHAPDFVTAMAIANASGLPIKVNGVIQKPPLSALATKVAGQVRVRAISAGPRAAYNWQMSTNGINWTDLPTSNTATVFVSSLTSGARYYFRVRSVVKNVTGIWSGAVNLVMQ